MNHLAGNLTNQVRAIAEVSTAVTRGDLTRSISVDAQGELAELKDNINQMIANLKETTEKNAQQDWLKSNLARISGQMQGQRDLRKVCQMIMSELTPVVEAHQGGFFLLAADEFGGERLRLTSSYAAPGGRGDLSFAPGEGLVGQAAVEKVTIRAPKVPPGYLEISSGLGSAPPADVLVTPVLFEEQVLGVIELASFSSFSELHRSFLEQLVETIGVVLNTIIANARTEELLTQSQRLAQELQVQSVELQRTNAELEEKASLLSEQNRNIEIKNREIEMARLGLEEKAEQLAAVQPVQDGVPGEHEPRAADPAQQPADPGPAARRQPRGQPHAEADRVRPDHPQRRLGPALADQRHPRPVQDRGRQDGRPARRGGPGRRLGLRRAELPPAGRGEGPGAVRPDRPRAARARSSPTASASSRCSRTCCRTP